MAKVLIGSLVGAVLIFLWQFASWTILDNHRPQQQYTPNQDTILAFLGKHINGDAAFFLPTTSQNATREEMEATMKSSIGKPWAQVFYHKEMKDNMVMNMIRGFAINFVIVLLFILIMGKVTENSFTNVLLSSVGVGLIVFFNSPYTIHIWYETFDVWAHLFDAVVAWGLVGLWLGWWLNRGK
ncbi:MAG: hypothetical protein QM725_06865 [Lacibacter sp.]